MFAPNRPWIITAQDVPDGRSVAYQTVEDCACPDDGMVFDAAAGAPMSGGEYVRPALHIAPLDADHHLVFNPLGQAGVVVLAAPALAVLDAFAQARSLAEGAAAARVGLGPAIAQRLADLQLLDPVGRVLVPRQARPRSLTAWLHVTNACNLRCVYCYLHKTPDPMALEQGRRAVEAVFRSAVAHQFRRVTLKYAGGEATLNLALVFALHEQARALAEQHGLGLDGIILSNGVALTEGKISRLCDAGLRLMISLDGVGASHDVQRPFANGRGSFTYVERTLDRLAAHGVRPAISITVTNRNLAGLPEVVAYVLARDLPFTLNFYRENECSGTIRDLAYGDAQIIAAMRAAFGVIEADLPPRSLLGALVDRARLDRPHTRACGAGSSYLVIDQNGKIAKCQMEIEQPITDVLAADPLQVLLDDPTGVQNPSVEEKEGCRECSWRYWCAGGCPALTFRVTGRFDVKSPNCRIYKALFPEVVRLEALRLLKYHMLN